MKSKNLTIGEFVKWTFIDDVGPYSYTGQVMALDEKTVTFRTDHGIMMVPWEGHGEIEKTKAIKLADERPELPVTTDREPAPVEKKGRQQKTGTKLEKAIAIYAQLEDKSRKNVIETFCKELGMTPAGASTYAATCKNKKGA